jgi:hypothetical protein
MIDIHMLIAFTIAASLSYAIMNSYAHNQMNMLLPKKGVFVDSWVYTFMSVMPGIAIMMYYIGSKEFNVV